MRSPVQIVKQQGTKNDQQVIVGKETFLSGEWQYIPHFYT